MERWKATIWYRHENGFRECVTHHFNEFNELGDFIERGPHWGTIIELNVSLYQDAKEFATLTVEKAKEM